MTLPNPPGAPPDVFLLRGLPGAGKSTLAQAIAGPGTVICTADDFLLDRAGSYRHTPRRQGYAHKRCWEKFQAAVAAGAPRIIVANTASVRREFARYQRLAEQAGYRVHVLTVENYHGGHSAHGVAPEALDTLAARYTIKLR